MRVTIVMVLVFGLAAMARAAGDDYLITTDIGDFVASKNTTRGLGAGILAGAGHFEADHEDVTYSIGYFNLKTRVGPDVQITKHAGGDSDRWLLHEMEDAYRDGDLETLGILTEGAVLRKIENQRVFWIGLGGGSFMWLSNNIVIKISYTGLQGSKPEPLEVIKAYLALHPSTLTLTDAELKSRDHNVKWIKDEMERRLWLGAKWMGRFAVTPAPDQRGILKQVADHLEVFLKYREKYHGLSATNEIVALNDLQRATNVAGIQTKLDDYNKWWNANKAGAISLP